MARDATQIVRIDRLAPRSPPTAKNPTVNTATTETSREMLPAIPPSNESSARRTPSKAAFTTSTRAVPIEPVLNKTTSQPVPTSACIRCGIRSPAPAPAKPDSRPETTNAVLKSPLRCCGLAPGKSRVSMGTKPDAVMTATKVIAEMTVLVTPMTPEENPLADNIQKT